MNDTTQNKQPVTIKKYANRRLYNTATSSYVTLEDLSAMVKEGIEFCVYDAKTSEDITRSVLTQIIVEEEGKSGQQNLLPIGFLRNLIGYYGDTMQWMVPKYLEHSMDMFSNNQDQIKSYFHNSFGSMFPFGSTFEEVSKQNMAMFERAMRMFNPSDEAQDSSATGSDAASCCAKETSSRPSNVTSLTPRSYETLSTSVSSSALSAATSESGACCCSTQPEAGTSTSCCSTKTDDHSSSCCSTAKSDPSDYASCGCAMDLSSVTQTQTSCCMTSAAEPTTSTPKTPDPMPTPTVSTSFSATPMPNVKSATASSASDSDDMQQKIANLQRQLAELAKNRA